MQPGLTLQQKTDFLAKLFRSMGDVSKACKAAGVSRSAIYEHRKNDEAFAQAWDDVLSSLCDAAEAELYRRGVKGWNEPVFYKGKKVASRYY
jgi:hypothetical protein